MMFRALAGLPPGSTTPSDYAGPVLKSHTFDPDALAGSVDVGLFLFGDVTASILSTMRYRNDATHFRNCGAGDLDPAAVDLSSGDHLNYERMFDAWMRPVGFPHACLRYERVHDLAPAIALLIGRPVDLPPRKDRWASPERADPMLVERIGGAYASLIAKVAAAPDLAWFG